MPTSTANPRAIGLTFKSEYMIVQLEDGREIAIPLAWYPRLANASSAERKKFQWIGKGTGIHWPKLDEDLSVEGLLSGQKSPEVYKSHRPVGSWFSPAR